MTVSRARATGPAQDVLDADDPAVRRPLPRSALALAVVLALTLLAASNAAVRLHRAQDREQRADQRAQAADVVDVGASSGRTSDGTLGDFFVTALLQNDGGDLQVVDVRWTGVGLELLQALGGGVPIAAGSTASFTAQVAPDCAVLRDAPATLAGRIEVDVRAGSGRVGTVVQQFDRELDLAPAARRACASGQAPAPPFARVRLVRVEGSVVVAEVDVAAGQRSGLQVEGVAAPGLLVGTDGAVPLAVEVLGTAVLPVRVSVADCSAAQRGSTVRSSGRVVVLEEPGELVVTGTTDAGAAVVVITEVQPAYANAVRRLLRDCPRPPGA